MKLFLFGGAEVSPYNVPELKKYIKDIIVGLHPSQVLHIPYARLHPTEEFFKEGWFKEEMKNTGIEVLDARITADLNRADGEVIFINGGHKRYELVLELRRNDKLRDLVMNAGYIVAESAGSMVLGEYLRRYRADEGNEIVKGLGILKDTVIEPHYTQRNSRELLLEEMKRSGMKYGLGIDSATAIVVDPSEFPDKYEKVGSGNVFIISNP